MKIEIKEEGYKSIKKLSRPNNIGNLCVLIGKNGAGKSHFLKAIAEEIIKIDNIEKSKIRYINQYAVSTSYDYPMLTEGVQKAWETFEIFRQHKPSANLIDLDVYTNQIEKWRGDLIYNALHSIVDTTNDEVSQIQKIDFNSFKAHAAYHEPVGLSDILNSLNGILRRKWFDHILKHFKEEKLPPLPLWETINTQLEELDIPHKIKYPNFSAEDLLERGMGNISYELKLITPDEEEIDITELSDGEKTLFLLALMGIISHKLPDFPELLLLDEPDIHLHPAMIDKFINIINKVFIDNGCKVIITTHSPVIVSKVKDESIYQIDKTNSEHSIYKIDQKEAVDILSDGTMNLDGILHLLLREALDKEIIILSEGNNIKHIDHAIQILEPNLHKNIGFPISHYKGIKSRTGQSQLFYLFDFFRRIGCTKKILFILDHDVSRKIKERDKFFKHPIPSKHVTSYFFIENPNSDSMKKKGVENLYNKSECSTYTYSGDFNKDDFLVYIQDQKNPIVFQNFQPLIAEIENLIKK